MYVCICVLVVHNCVHYIWRGGKPPVRGEPCIVCVCMYVHVCKSIDCTYAFPTFGAGENTVSVVVGVIRACVCMRVCIMYICTSRDKTPSPWLSVIRVYVYMHFL
jgi:hypothetical protein